MSTITISNLDDATVAKLRHRAAQRSQSMESYVRDILKGHADARSDAAVQMQRSRSLTPKAPQTDSTDIIRQLRDE